MATSGAEDTSKQSTPASDMLGTLISSFSKLAIFQPIDTVSTNAMSGNENFEKFKTDLKHSAWPQKLRLLYSGSFIEIFKKIPSNSFRYPAQRATQGYIDTHYHDMFVEMFGEQANVAQATAAGGLSAVVEPLIIQPLDALIVNKQVYHTPLRETLKQFTFRDYYRAVGVTGLCRNLPAGITLFGVSAHLDKLFGNEDKHSTGLNVTAKTIAGVVSVVTSQPGDVLKVQMQTHQWSLRQALRRVTFKEYATSGSSFRLFGGFKAGIGYFMAEQAMEFSAKIFGETKRNAP